MKIGAYNYIHIPSRQYAHSAIGVQKQHSVERIRVNNGFVLVEWVYRKTPVLRVLRITPLYDSFNLLSV